MSFPLQENDVQPIIQEVNFRLLIFHQTLAGPEKSSEFLLKFFSFACKKYFCFCLCYSCRYVWFNVIFHCWDSLKKDDDSVTLGYATFNARFTQVCNSLHFLLTLGLHFQRYSLFQFGQILQACSLNQFSFWWLLLSFLQGTLSLKMEMNVFSIQSLPLKGKLSNICFVRVWGLHVCFTCLIISPQWFILHINGKQDRYSLFYSKWSSLI